MRRFSGTWHPEIALFVSLLAACGGTESQPPSVSVAPSAALAEHGKEFRKEVIEVTGGVHVAVGFGIANSILIEGVDGFIVVDTMESVEEAAAVNAEFRRIAGSRPLKAIIYTHNHPDHTFGAAAFVQPGETPAIYAHATINQQLDALITEFRPVINRRSLRMYGFWLGGDALGNMGVGPFLGLRAGSTLSILRPTKTFQDTLEDEVAGIRFRLEHAPGETDDHIFVWLPDRKTLLPGDNFYKAFPNLYTIRGTPYRNPRKWADSLDRIRAIRPEFLVPSHTRPLAGADNIYAVLTDYRDAIRYVYDQTVRAMNQGLTPDEAAQRVKLPPHLAGSPYLQEFYGKPSWSTRMIFGGSVGWFDGNPATLQPLAPLEQARRVADLAGGEDALAAALQKAVEQSDWQWVLELSDYLLRLQPVDGDAKSARVKALTALGEAESNPNARHYYLMSALELREGRSLPDQVAKPQPQMLKQMPLTAFFTGLSVNLNAAKTLEMNQKTGFEFTDTDETYTLWVRRGVTELRPVLMDGLDLHVRVDSLVFKEMLAQLRSPAVTLAKDFEVVHGSKLGLIRFMSLFQSEKTDE
jgi:alkyl sulfatase BDS1-like metallo-beta-lactamase superfamily hydrolase